MDQKAVGKKRINSKKKLSIMITKDNQNNSGSGTESEDDHQIHIWTERERRKKMRNMFSSLRDLLPSDNLPLKADKSSIVDEAVKHIKTLEHTLQTLQKQKLSYELQINCAATTNTVDHDHDQIKSTRSSQHDHDHDRQSREVFLADQHYDQESRDSKNIAFAPREIINRATNFQTWFSPNVVVNTCGDDTQISVCSPRKPGLLATVFHILEKHNLYVISAHISSDLCRSLCMIHVRASGASEEFVQVEDVVKLAASEINLWLLSCQ